MLFPIGVSFDFVFGVNWRREKREIFNFVSENLDSCGF